MGMLGVFKWLRKDVIQRDRHRQTLPTKLNTLNNEAYRSALQAFLERRKNSDNPGNILCSDSPDKTHLDLLIKKNSHSNIAKNNINDKLNIVVSKLPNVTASDIFEIGWVAGTEDRYIELICAEWQNTKVCLRRQTHPECKNAVKTDLDILDEIRHPNILLLMGFTQTDDHGIIAIYEPVDCTLFNYIHEQGERVSVQGIAKSAKNIAAALKHAHMLGYIHSAISPHCVFLSSNGMIKLGGWELASDSNKPKSTREYEERLRSEILNWQAPELSIGQQATVATDVYGLTLLIWEMCTMQIPWNGTNILEVQKHYMQSKRSITTDTYNFPPLLSNLLEVGMQFDVSKRTLDMIKITRFLQTLEMQYEDEQPIYVERMTNNDAQETPDIPPPINMSSTEKFQSIINSRSSKGKKQFLRKLHSRSSLKKELKEKKRESHEISPDEPRNRIKKINKVSETECNDVTDSIPCITKLNEIENKNLDKAISIIDSCYTDVNNRFNDVTNENTNYLNDSRLSLKKLKESLATQREKFFYGDVLERWRDTYHPATNESPKTHIISEVRSKNYEPHKPASHKTDLQPKTATLSSKNSMIPKVHDKKKQKSPYAYVPTPVRKAVIQPKVLNPNSQSFFETSLWQREKEICLSKGPRGKLQSHQPNSNHQINNTEITKNLSPASDETFIVDINPSASNSKYINENFAQTNDSEMNTTVSTIPRSKSLLALHDALEKATDLLKSSARISSFDNSPITSLEHNKNVEKLHLNAINLRNIYHLRKAVHDEIRGMDLQAALQEPRNEPSHEFKAAQSTSDQSIKLKITSITTGILPSPMLVTRYKCESMTDNSEILDHYTESEREDVEKFVNSERKETANLVMNARNLDEFKPKADFLDFDNQIPENTEWTSCSRRQLIRRRSLPAGLGRSKCGYYISLKKGIKNKDSLPDTTVEDLYIDDEFSESSLAPNMLLLTEEGTSVDDEIYLSDLPEDTPNLHYH